MDVKGAWGGSHQHVAAGVASSDIGNAPPPDDPPVISAVQSPTAEGWKKLTPLAIYMTAAADDAELMKAWDAALLFDGVATAAKVMTKVEDNLVRIFCDAPEGQVTRGFRTSFSCKAVKPAVYFLDLAMKYLAWKLQGEFILERVKCNGVTIYALLSQNVGFCQKCVETFRNSRDACSTAEPPSPASSSAGEDDLKSTARCPWAGTTCRRNVNK